MESKYLLLSVGLVLALFCIEGAFSLKCYTCAGSDSSDIGGNCRDPFNSYNSDTPVPAKPCNINKKFCEKRIYKDSKGNTHWIRNCAVDCAESTSGSNSTYCCKLEDGCNGGSSLGNSVILLLTTVVMAIMCSKALAFVVTT